MNIKRLQTFVRVLSDRCAAIHQGALNSTVAYWHARKWYETNGEEITNKGLKHCLDSARKSQIYRPAKDRKVYFWIKQFEAVAAVDFASAIYAKAQQVAADSLSRIAEDAVNEYRATFDTHTGLKNRLSFDQHLLQALEQTPAVTTSVSESEANAQTSTKQSVVLASLDIDLFKTINDRFGHGYGDLVLAALAVRVEKAIAQIVSESGGKFSADAFRLGGEEFQILVVGDIAEQEGVAVAQKIAESIRREVLPTANEYQNLSAAGFADGAMLPHDSDRKVTASIGVAISIGGLIKPTDAAKRIKRQADLALYSAKIGGRDRVRYFGEILERGGRVNSVDKINGIISIDIGREVGVKNGQEFFLFPPNYDGQTSFYMGEGRSKKHVGFFPRYHTARVTTFDVQNEVSFCRVVELQEGVKELLEGSTLQAIPLGSISHLVGEIGGSLKFQGQDSLREEVGAIGKSSAVGVIAVTINDIEKISEEKGLDKANECLGLAGRFLLNSLKSHGKFAQANLGGFLAAVSGLDRGHVENKATQLFADISAQLDGVEIGVGWCFQDAKDTSVGALNDVRGLVDAALLAAIRSSEEKAARKFTKKLWASSLAGARTRGEYSRAIADYELFSRLGLSSPSADTQMAFVALNGSIPNLDSAESFFRQAATDPEATPVIKSNLGCFLITSGRIAEGFSFIRDVEVPDGYVATLFFGALKSLTADEFKNYIETHKNRLPRAREGRRAWLRPSELTELEKALSIFDGS